MEFLNIHAFIFYQCSSVFHTLPGQYTLNLQRFSGQYTHNLQGLSGQYTYNLQGLSGQYNHNLQGLSGQYTHNFQGLSGQYTQNLQGLPKRYGKNGPLTEPPFKELNVQFTTIYSIYLINNEEDIIVFLS